MSGTSHNIRVIVINAVSQGPGNQRGSGGCEEGGGCALPHGGSGWQLRD